MTESAFGLIAAAAKPEPRMSYHMEKTEADLKGLCIREILTK